MATITGFRCVDSSGQDIECDAFGNNVALKCPNCGHPILAIARENQRGSDSAHVVSCRRCDLACWIEVDIANSVLALRQR
jgi:hypothetical protein